MMGSLGGFFFFHRLLLSVHSNLRTSVGSGCGLPADGVGVDGTAEPMRNQRDVCNCL